MSAHRTKVVADASSATLAAAAIILCELVTQAKPKAVARARAALLDRAKALETRDGCRLPAGVVSLNEWRGERVFVNERRERAEVAAAIRSLLNTL